MGDGEVDQGRPDAGEDQPGAELHPVCGRTGDDAGREAGEHQVQGRQRQRRQGASSGAVSSCPSPGVLQGVAEQPQPADGVAEDSGVAKGDPQHPDDAERAEDHEHHVHGGFAADHPAVEKGQAGQHQGDRNDGGQNPRRIARDGGSVHTNLQGAR